MKPSTTLTSSQPNSNTHIYLLSSIILWVWGSNGIWMILDIRPPSWDQAGHLRYTFHYWQVLTSGSENWWIDLLNVEPFYPPFFHLSLIPFSLIFGFTMDAAIVANSFYLTIAVLSTYGIGKLLSNRHTGLIAGFLLSCYPFMVSMSREYLISTMLTSAVTLAYFLFLKSREFEDKIFSLVFSLVYVCGLMIKWTFLIYTFPAVIIGLFSGSLPIQRRLAQYLFYAGMVSGLIVLPFLIFISGEISWVFLLAEFLLIFILVKSYSTELVSHQKLLNLVTLTCISILICFPWYAHNIFNISIGISKFGFPAEILKGSMDWNLPIWAFYLEIAERQMGMPLFMLFTFSFIYLLIRREGSLKQILLWWAIFPIIVFTFINNKGARYTMPGLPAMALISSIALTQIQGYPWRKILYALTGFFGIITSLSSGFINRSIPIPFLGGQLLGFKNPPVVQQWPIDKILDDIISDSGTPASGFLTVRTLTNHPYFQRGGFRDSAEIRNLPIVIKSVKRNVGEMTDYFITKTGDFGMHAFKDINPKLTRLLKEPALKKTFKTHKYYRLPDGTKGVVFKKDVQPATHLADADNLEVLGKRILTAFSNYPIYGIKNAVNLTISIIPTENPGDLFLGRYREIRIKADSVVSNNVKIDDFELILENIQINIYDLILNNKLILFNLKRLTPKGTLDFESLERDVSRATKKKGSVNIVGSGNGILIQTRYTLPQGQILEGSAKINLLFS